MGIYIPISLVICKDENNIWTLSDSQKGKKEE
jgi:hypothetical protein